MPDCELALPDPEVVSEWNNSANPHTLPRPLCCQKTSPAGANQSVEQFGQDWMNRLFMMRAMPIKF